MGGGKLPLCTFSARRAIFSFLTLCGFLMLQLLVCAPLVGHYTIRHLFYTSEPVNNRPFSNHGTMDEPKQHSTRTN
jgi:hypothetical protein